MLCRVVTCKPARLKNVRKTSYYNYRNLRPILYMFFEAELTKTRKNDTEKSTTCIVSYAATK